MGRLDRDRKPKLAIYRRMIEIKRKERPEGTTRKLVMCIGFIG